MLIIASTTGVQAVCDAW